MGIEQDAARLDATIRSVSGSYSISVDRYESEYAAIKESVICARDRLLTLDDGEAEAKAYRMPWTELSQRMGEVTLWTGFAKHGKSTALNQVVLKAMQQGARVGMLSLEFPINSLLRVMRHQSFGITNSPLTENQRGAFVEWVGDRLWLLDQVKVVPTRLVLATVWGMVKHLNLDVIVIDSLMRCGVPVDGEGYASHQSEFINRLLSIAAQGCHIHLVAHARKAGDDSKPCNLMDVSGSANLVNLPHTVLTVWRDKSDRRNEDAKLVVLGDRQGGRFGATNLWWHDGAMQFLANRDEIPHVYCDREPGCDDE